MNLASSSSDYNKSSSRQKNAILRKFRLSSEISGSAERSYRITPFTVWRSI